MNTRQRRTRRASETTRRNTLFCATAFPLHRRFAIFSNVNDGHFQLTGFVSFDGNIYSMMRILFRLRKMSYFAETFTSTRIGNVGPRKKISYREVFAFQFFSKIEPNLTSFARNFFHEWISTFRMQFSPKFFWVGGGRLRSWLSKV